MGTRLKKQGRFTIGLFISLILIIGLGFLTVSVSSIELQDEPLIKEESSSELITGAAIGLKVPTIDEIINETIISEENHSIFKESGLISIASDIGIQEEANSTSCGVVNSNIILENNVESNETCFYVNESNLYIDCAGFQVNFSVNGSIGYGVNNTGYDNVTVKNCNFVVGSNIAQLRFAIYYSGSSDGYIYNNSINVYGSGSLGLGLYGASHQNTISANNITTAENMPVYLASSSTCANNTFVNNDLIRLSGSDRIGDYSSGGQCFQIINKY